MSTTQKSTFYISANLVDVRAGSIYPAEVKVVAGRIAEIQRLTEEQSTYLIPGFVDAHVHVESSMLLPSEFARLAVTHGTVGTVSDPHEIANVLGVQGVEYMIDNGRRVPFHFYFGAPSCVPATDFETAGARIGPEEVDALLSRPDIVYLAEVMNYPGVINRDPDMLAKISAAKRHGKVVDGHAPGLRGRAVADYVAAGISTDHECFTAEEALEKLGLGMKILIREGSAAKNFDALIPLFSNHADQMMFCSDDKHPDELVKGHIDVLVRRAIALGHDPMQVIRAASMNVIDHYSLDIGLLGLGDAADMVVVSDLSELRILKTYIQGELVAANGTTHIERVEEEPINHFVSREITLDELRVRSAGDRLRVITVEDGQLMTGEEIVQPKVTAEGFVESDTSRDILKMVVVNRYGAAPPAMAFVKNFGLQRGAIGSTVAHDSHNIIAIGTTDVDLLKVIELLMKEKGGVAICGGGESHCLALPVAGLMSAGDGYEVAKRYEEIDLAAKAMGSTLSSPFMTLSFCALLVIPKLKLSDRGLFDGERFNFTDLSY